MKIQVVFLFISSVAFAQNQQALNNKGVMLLDEEHYKEALPIFDTLVTLNPSNSIYRYNRAVTLFNLKKYKDAIADYTILSTMLPTESEYIFQIGNAYEHLDSARLAIDYFSQSITLE